MENRKDKKIWQDTAEVLQMIRDKTRKITIITHLDPDGDAIGTALGLMRVMRNIGHNCYVVLPNAYPDFLGWMPGNEGILVYQEDPERVALRLGQAEIIISVDFNTLERVEAFKDIVLKSSAYKLLIDHHPDPESFADCIISDTSVSSCSELVYQFLKKNDLDRYMDEETASCFFAGILTDTGCFSYNSSNPETYNVVSELMKFHIDKDEIYDRVYDNFSGDRMRLLGYCLNKKLSVIRAYHTAYIWITKQELLDYNFQVGDSEGFVNYPLSIKDIWFSVLFIEKEDHIKISFRSKGKFAVNSFAAKHFNGGGHRNASGGLSYDTMDATLKRFTNILDNTYKEDLSV